MPLIDTCPSPDRRISILHFTNSTLWGGVERHICDLFRTISRDLFRVHLVCDPLLYDRFRDAISRDVAVTPVALSSPKDAASAMGLAMLIRRNKFRIVHSHMFWSSLFASPIARACRVPVIVETLHGTEAWRTGWKANRLVDRATTLFVSRYIAVSQSDANFLKTQKGVSPDSISLIHNGVDLQRFSVDAVNARGAIRRSLGISEHDPVLVVVARFHPGKGHRILLEALLQLVPLHPNLKLICLGEGEQETELRDTCERFGLTQAVRFVGHRKNVPEWLAAADINVLPTFYEGFPLTVLEAMAAGLPTVASNVGGIPEAIEHGVSGLLVPRADPTSLARALASLLDHPALRLRLGRAARTRLERDFVLTRQVSLTENLYFDLCGADRVGEHPAVAAGAKTPGFLCSQHYDS